MTARIAWPAAGCLGEGPAAKLLPSPASLRRSFFPISNTVVPKKNVLTPTRKFRIAERLAQARRSVAPALSQAALAKQVAAIGLKDCSGSRLSRLEAGYADAQWPEIEALATALKVSAQWLAAVDDPPPPAPPEVSVPPSPVLAVPPGPNGLPAAAQANGVHPELALLERGAHRSDYDFRQHLAAALGRARAKPHEAGLPAADWKHWRTVERRAMEELRRCS